MIERAAASAGLELKAHPHMLRHHALALPNKTLAAEALRPAKEISGLSLEITVGVRRELYASGDDEDGDLYGR
jgi:hypothetical protein